VALEGLLKLMTSHSSDMVPGPMSTPEINLQNMGQQLWKFEKGSRCFTEAKNNTVKRKKQLACGKCA